VDGGGRGGGAESHEIPVRMASVAAELATEDPQITSPECDPLTRPFGSYMTHEVRLRDTVLLW
jgi:hypothetical protein